MTFIKTWRKKNISERKIAEEGIGTVSATLRHTVGNSEQPFQAAGLFSLPRGNAGKGQAPWSRTEGNECAWGRVPPPEPPSVTSRPPRSPRWARPRDPPPGPWRPLRDLLKIPQPGSRNAFPTRHTPFLSRTSWLRVFSGSATSAWPAVREELLPAEVTRRTRQGVIGALRFGGIHPECPRKCSALPGTQTGRVRGSGEQRCGVEAARQRPRPGSRVGRGGVGGRAHETERRGGGGGQGGGHVAGA